MENINVKFMKALSFALDHNRFSFSAEWNDDHITIEHRGMIIAIAYLDENKENIVVEEYEGKLHKFPFLAFRCSNEELVDDLSSLLYSLCW